MRTLGAALVVLALLVFGRGRVLEAIERADRVMRSGRPAVTLGAAQSRGAGNHRAQRAVTRPATAPPPGAHREREHAVPRLER